MRIHTLFLLNFWLFLFIAHDYLFTLKERTIINFDDGAKISCSVPLNYISMCSVIGTSLLYTHENPLLTHYNWTLIIKIGLMAVQLDSNIS